MKNNFMMTLKVFAIGSIITVTPLQTITVIAEESSKISDDLESIYTLNTNYELEDKLTISGQLDPDASYILTINLNIYYEIETDQEGFYSLDVSSEKLDPSNEYKIESLDNIVMLEGEFNFDSTQLYTSKEEEVTQESNVTENETENPILDVALKDEIVDNVPEDEITKDTLVNERKEEVDLDNNLNTEEKVNSNREFHLVSPSSSTSILQNQPKGKTYHFVQPGETLFSLANVYKTTVNNLLQWNKLSSTSALKAGSLISIDGQNVYDEITQERTTFSNNQEFLNYIVPYAKDISQKHNLYTSVMIAQALHESNWGRSNLAKMGNNLFGVKGSYNGNSVVMLTWEEKPNGEIIWIQDRFRLYPTFYESIVDNAIKLRDGVSWDRNFYSGAWVENTASHMDATEWLTGRYATDSLYNVKVNNTIRTHGLLQYDEHIKITNPITSQRNLNNETLVTTTSTPIYSQPYGTASFRQLGSSNQYRGKTLNVKQEKVNDLGSWYLLYDGSRQIGWINQSGITGLYYPVTNTTNVNYRGLITQPWSVNSRPWGTAGAEPVVKSGSLVGKIATITKEKTTARATYALISINNQEIGWIDISAIDRHVVLESKSVNFDVKLTQPWSINTKPWGVTGYETVEARATVGKTYSVTREAITPLGTYVLLNDKGREIGWIDKGAVERLNSVISKSDVTYAADVVQPWSINTRPWGTIDAESIMSARSILGKTVEVTREKVTDRGTYALIKQNNKELGWIDKTGLSPHTVQSRKSVNYIATITKPWSINTQPWGINGYKTVSSGNSILGKTMNVIEERVTPRSRYLLLEENGKTLGWIDETGVSKNTSVSSHRDVDYNAMITKPWSINTAPWGTNGSNLVARGQNYLNEIVTVKAEQVTERSTYALIEHNGKELGWIDITGIENYIVTSKQKVNYIGTIIKPWSINTKPFGIKGFETVISGNTKVGRTVNILEEQVTPRGTYLLIEENGTILGWIDQTGVNKNTTIQSHHQTNYAATITKPWSINTAPWGSQGFKNITSASNYIGEEVRVVAEQVTTRSTFALIQHKGKNLGWIDTTGIAPHTVLSERSVSYTVTITQPWSINSKPWGIKGFETLTSGSSLVGQTARVIKEQQTPRSTFLLLERDGQEIGWIDSTGVKK